MVHSCHSKCTNLMLIHGNSAANIVKRGSCELLGSIGPSNLKSLANTNL